MSTQKRRSSLSTGEKLMFLAGAMFSLILITTAMMGGLFARYLSTGDSQDAARVARFHPSVTLDKVENKDGTFALTVKNESEVAVRYGIVVTLERDLAGISADLYPAGSVEAIKPDPEAPDEPLTMTFGDLGTLPAGTQSQTYDLVFKVDWAKIDFTQQDTNDDPKTEPVRLDFSVDVTVVQID